jgi:glycosyltransferase involved in cell wall biosynthesis
MPNVVILQRVVPSYRLPIFQRIWDELGWSVAYGQNLGTEGMSLQREAPFLRGFNFKTSKNGFVRVPVGEILRSLKPDAVIAEGALRLTSTWELTARRFLFKSPQLYFWSIGYNTTKGLDEDGIRKHQWLYPAVFKFADGCLTYGEDGRSFLEPRMGGKPVFVAHNTVDMVAIRKFRDSVPARARGGFPELVSMSRLMDTKKYVLLVQAFHILRQTMPNARLTIIGEGPDRSAIEAAAGSELGRSIVLTGAIYDEEKIAIHMNAADAFVMAGRMGLAINHALAYDLPTVCFRRTESGPYHGSEIAHLKSGLTGQFVESFTADAMAASIVEMFRITPDPRASYKNSIQNYVDEHLSVDRMVSGFRAIDNHLRTKVAKTVLAT